MTERQPGFFTAPFGIDGEPMGLGYWELAALSGKWLAVCSEHLKRHGPSFDTPWEGNLSHIETKLTSAPGLALATFRRGKDIAASMLLATGRAPEAESEVLDGFVQSLRRSPLVRAAAAKEPFQKAFTIKERPLMIVVCWPDERISDEDQELVQELAIHLAAAFFAQDLRPASD